VSQNLTILKAIRDDLHAFASPENHEGFLPSFCDWVLSEWNSRAYFISELMNFGYDLAHFPFKTDFLLKDKARVYRDFIHSNNGHQYAALLSGHGSSCETMEKNLYEFFHESMRLRALGFLLEAYPEVDSEQFWNRIFCEDFEERRELLVAEDISVHFGFYGLAVEPYICHPSPEDRTHECRFALWDKEDFEATLELLEREATRRNLQESFRLEPPRQRLTPGLVHPA